MPDLFKTLIFDLWIRAGLAWLFAAVPILGWGPIGWVVTWIVTKLAEGLYEIGREKFNFTVIILKNESHRRAYDAASVKLKLIGAQTGFDSPEFKRQRDESTKALSQFVRLDV